ncbi:polysaccharide deacetylase family protein [Qipengyuania sp. MTN3-11]|uniref:polysaccharide deacetylase family protein n=1 Tax=Qipengyuania sp. MTN3-11 TaxID=3056557 RepID=UPI0036F3EDC7
MLTPPASGQRARFPRDFGQRVLLTVDTEEEFDWDGEFHAFDYGLDHLGYLADFQAFCEEIAVVPVYLVDWPIANSRLAADILGDAARRGKAEIGIQLHPWVNPPHEEEVGAYTSYAGNLPPDLMREKFRRLRDAIVANFGCTPQIYRAGRYGLGAQSAQMLTDAGVAVDSSVRSHYDYSAHDGPNYSTHPVWPYWVGHDRRLLELPLTTVYWGMLRQLGRKLFPLVQKVPRLGGLLARAGLLERIALTPEGVPLSDALRGIDIALDDGLPVLVLSFHSPSLMPGKTPYVRSEDDLDELYRWLGGVYSYLRTRGVHSTTVAEIVGQVDV